MNKIVLTQISDLEMSKDNYGLIKETSDSIYINISGNS